jgi:predicted aspartyl protease
MNLCKQHKVNQGLISILGKVILDGKEYEIPVHLGDNITEVLLGSEWLKFLRLVVDFPEDILTLG